MHPYNLAGQPVTNVAAEPLAERERALWIASGQYMRGEITKEQLEDKERLYDPRLFSSDPTPLQATHGLSLWNRCKEAVLEFIDS